MNSAKDRFTLRRLWHENGLSIVTMGLFLIFWVAQGLTGFFAYNSDRREHHESPVVFSRYLTTGHFISATAENWESEFLQMGLFVWLTARLFQKGSAESLDPYEKQSDPPVTHDSPWPARRGGWVRQLYARSLTITLLLLFVISFLLHSIGSQWLDNEQHLRRGQPPVTWFQHLGSSEFWFESFQNWQSEFLAIGVMVILSIYLRHEGSAQSKPVNTPHEENK